MKLSKIALRNIARNKRRSLLSIVAIAVAAMSIAFLFSFLEGYKNDLADNLHTYYSGEIRVRHKDYGKNEYLNPLHLRIESFNDVIEEIEKNDAVEAVSPRISFHRLRPCRRKMMESECVSYMFLNASAGSTLAALLDGIRDAKDATITE
ncbi:hypothetical protein ES705_41898 [subsurface metagenome]